MITNVGSNIDSNKLPPKSQVPIQAIKGSSSSNNNNNNNVNKNIE